MNKILEKIKEVLDKTGFLALSLVHNPDSQALEQLLEKIKVLGEITKGYGVLNELAERLLGVLNLVKTGEIAASEQLAEIVISTLEFLLEVVEKAEAEGGLQVDEEACRKKIEQLGELFHKTTHTNVSHISETANQMEIGKRVYEVSLEMKASAESPDLLAIYEKLASCGEVIRVVVNDVDSETEMPSFLSMHFYLGSDLSTDALENMLAEVLGDLTDLRLTICPAFLETGEPGFGLEDVSPGISNEEEKTFQLEEKSAFSLDIQLNQEETKVLQLILAQLREYLGQVCSREDFSRYCISVARILAGIGMYFNRLELKKAEEIFKKPNSEWQRELFSLLDTAEKMARSLVAKEGTSFVPAPKKPEGMKISIPATSSKSIRVDETKIDHLMALAGELVVKCNAFLYVARKVEEEYGLAEVASELKEQHSGLDRLVRELQDAVMNMRLLPASYIFQKFPRMVRDLARELGKKVELRLEGEDTEIDKTVMETIGEPMVHLVRNAIDHGLEPPEERLDRGKRAEGTITLRALREGNKIVLEVEDDGRGIDVEHVRQKAISVGLISAEEAGALTEEQVLEFLFVSGFSTAEEVTEVSGRGVGMDAVRAAVRSLGGSIKIKTSPGAGTRVRMELPLTLATSRVLLVVQNGRKYGLPIADVREMVKVHSSELASMQGKRIVVIRGELVPVFFLGEFFDDDKKETGDEELCLVILTNGFALAVDDFLGQEDIVLKPLPADFGSDSCFAGAAILGDGSILLVLDPYRMWRQLQQTNVNK
ncbi:chemotaxis protein CheA [Anoxybacter fermentans]|nr:chemotaxis protein CheA [Anoxybacter fermentans]